MGCTEMKRYYILINKTHTTEAVGGGPYFVTEWSVVPTRGEPIGDNCFYKARKWCGEMMYFLYDTPTGAYICRDPTLKDLQYRIESEEFKSRLEKVRKSDYYNIMLRTFNKALKEYKEIVKGGKKK